jgi:membrane protease subunit (stomatin/prohibitin family)
VRITRPLIGTAVGAGALGATLALGLGMANAATTGHPASTKSHSATSSQASTSQATSSAAAQRTTAKHTCPNHGHGATSGTGMPAGM